MLLPLELEQLTGIAAILRFPIAELDEEEFDEEDELDEQWGVL